MTDHIIRRALCALCLISLAAGLLPGCGVRQSDDAAATAETTETTSQSTTAATDGTTAESESSDTATTDSPETDAPTTAPEDTTTVPATEPTGGSAAEQVDPPIITAGASSTGMKIEVIGGVTYVGGVLVANKTYSLPESYYIGGLTDETYAAFIAMQSAAAAEGLTLFCKSGFRSYVDQRIIYDGYVGRDGQALADTYSARPGHSEHQSGMALDINSTASAFADTPEGKWLAEHCWDYGFIIRYPADKVEITGYMYEPWHVRYVGKEIAVELKDSGLCLEEYLGITSKYAE